MHRPPTFRAHRPSGSRTRRPAAPRTASASGESDRRRTGRARRGWLATVVVATAVAAAAGGAVTADPASAGPEAVPVTCPGTLVANGTRYGFVAISATVAGGVYDFGPPEPAECADGVAAVSAVIEARLPESTARRVGDWSCTAQADGGGTCLRTTATRAVRMTGRCETEEETVDDEPTTGGGGTEEPGCVKVDDPGTGSGSGDGGGSGSGAGGSGSGADDGAGASAGAARTVVVDRSNRLRSAPLTLTLPRGAKGSRLRWTRWGRATTTGRGRVVLRAGGRTRRGTGRVVLAGRTLCDDGRRVYTRATVRLGRRSVRLTRPGCVRLT